MLIDSAPLYREMGPFHIKDFSVYDGLVNNGLPLAALLESYNAWLIQKEHGAQYAQSSAIMPDRTSEAALKAAG